MVYKAMSSALKSDSFTRTRGAEKQGTKLLSDYYPEPTEISEYWREILDKLSDEAVKETQYSNLCAEIISGHTRGLFVIGVPGLIIPAIQKVAKKKDYDWQNLLDSLHLVRIHDKGRLHKNDMQKVEGLIASLTKETFSFKYSTINKRNYREDIGLSWEEASRIRQEKYKLLAEEFVRNEDYTDENFNTMYSNQHIISAPFGQIVAELLASDVGRVKFFIDRSIRELNSLEITKRNPHVLTCFAQGLTNMEHRSYLIQKLSSENHLAYLIFSIYGLWTKPFSEVALLFELVKENKAEISSFMQFFGNYLGKPRDEDISELCLKISELNIDGKKVSLKILQNFIQFQENSNSKIINTLKTIAYSLSKEDIIELGVEIYFENILILLEKIDDVNLAKLAIERIISLVGQIEIFNIRDYELKKILRILISNYFDVVWPPLSKALLSQEFLIFYHLQHFLENKNHGMESVDTILMHGDLEVIFEWCRENTEIAPARLAYMIPLYANGEMHSLTIRLLDEFGDKENLLDVLSAQIHSYSFVGSVIPLLQSRKDALQSLLSHSKKEVVIWAEKNIREFETEIERTNQREAEEKFLYY